MKSVSMFIGRFSIAVAAMFVLSACDKQQARSVQSTNIANTGDCSAILQNINVGRDINVDLHCDVPTEKKLIQQVANGAWKTKCPYTLPADGWQVNENSVSTLVDIIPIPGSYWSKFNVSFSVERVGFSQLTYIYANGLDWEYVHERFPTVDEEIYSRILEVARRYPPSASIPKEAQEAVHAIDDAPASQAFDRIEKDIVARIDVRRKINYEDGSRLETLKIPVHNSNSLFKSSIAILPYVDAYPSGLAGNLSGPQPTEFICSASNEISEQSYAAICKMFFERQFLSPDIMTGDACTTK